MWAAPDAPRGAYPDLDKAVAGLVQLWGSSIGGREKDLSAAGNFVALAAVQVGLKPADIIDADGDAVKDFLDGYGEGVTALPKTPPVGVAVGDLVRYRRGGLWGLCTAVDAAGAVLDVLGQGGAKGRIGEPEGAVTLQKGVDAALLGWSWRPSAAKRA